MAKTTAYFLAIGANLTALRAVLTDAIADVDNGLEAIEEGQQNTAIGSIMPTEHLIAQANTLIQAIFILHRRG